MALETGARTGAIALASALFAFGCTASSSKTDQGETNNATNDDSGSMNGSTNDGSSSGGTAATDPPAPVPAAVTNPVVITNLTADQTGKALNVAPSTVNAWGIAAFNGMFWVADAGTGKISIFDGKGVPATGKVASGAIDLGEGITGIAVSGLASDDMTSFQLHTSGMCAAAQLIVASEDGKLFGLNPDINPTGGFVVVDRSDVKASYKGVAVLPAFAATQGMPGQVTRGPMVLAADFHNARIDVFDASFSRVETPSLVVPSMPAGFAPFNVMVFGSTIYVAYAMQDADKADEVAGKGLGFIAAFDMSGKLLGTAKGDQLNAPWGMVMAPRFAPFPDALLVGNFGDGAITAIDPTQLTVLGQLMDKTGKPAMVDGLWGLALGTTVTNAVPDGVYFTAGPDDEMHGLFGSITPAPAPAP
jgi:uncharacterized protein (TIGR03118 family)